MIRRSSTILMIACCVCFTQAIVNAQEFPIAVGADTSFAQGGAFDGTHYLAGLVSNHYDLTTQFFQSGGIPYGSRFSLGATGSGLTMAFDGTRYLAVWTDPFPIFASGDTNGIGNLHAEFISTSGTVGSHFDLVSNVNLKFSNGRGGVIFEDTDYFLFYLKGGLHQDHLYCQLIDKSGNLVGSPTQVSSGYARESAVAFDGTNYLVAWVEGSGVDEFIYGQFLAKNGSLVGSNFLIDGSTNKSDNPVTVTFDGERYFVSFHDQAAGSQDTSSNFAQWNLYGRFVTPSGEVAPNKVTICDSSKMPDITEVAFDGTNYLATWIEPTTTHQIKGRFFCTSGVPVDTAFTVFDTLNGKSPFGGVSGFINGKYLLGAQRLNSTMTDCDVYGKFMDPLTAHGNSLAGTWQRSSGPGDVATYYFNSGSLVTMSNRIDTILTTRYSVDTSVTPHRFHWYADDGKLINLGIWKIEGSILTMKASNGDTITFPATFDSETNYPWLATTYTKVTQVTDVKTNVTEMPKSFELLQNYPNPFNPSTVISYQLSAAAQVTLRVYDVLGRELKTLVAERQTAGYHSVTFNASHLSSGVYFYRLQSGTYSATKKLLLLK